MDANHTLHAVFELLEYRLTIVESAGGATDPTPGTYTYVNGTYANVTAIPNTYYVLDYWLLDGNNAGSANPISILMTDDHTLQPVFAKVNYTLTIETTTGGTTSPAPDTYTYTASSDVEVTAIPSSGYVFDHWELNGSNVGSANPYTVNMDNNYVLKAFFASAPSPPSVSIDPMSASILVGEHVTFTSTVSGGTPPYSYQWYLNGAPVSGATSDTWTFTPTASGTYYVYLEVTDDAGNTAQSDTAQVTVSSVPVGGYSISLTKKTPPTPMAAYTLLLVLFGAVLTLIKRKRK